MRPITDQPLTCASCDGAIVGRPEFHVGLAFCCAGCVVGGPCTCSYDVDPFWGASNEAPAEAPAARVEVLV